jgi:hypothetical protein
MPYQSMSEWFNAAVCDASECDTWSTSPKEHGFLALQWGTSKLIYCCADHLLQDVARRSAPKEVFDL